MRISQTDKESIEKIMDKVGGGPGMRGILKSFYYWHGLSEQSGKKRMTQRRFGHLYIAKSANEWGDEANVKGTTARKLIAKLAKAGVIHKFQGIFGGRKVIFARLVEDPYPSSETVQKYRIDASKTQQVPDEYRTERPQVPVLESGTHDRTFYVHSPTNTNSSTSLPNKTDSTGDHPQKQLMKRWDLVKSLILKTASDATRNQLLNLRPRLLPNGKIYVNGPVSQHLRKLLEGRFKESIEFQAA